MTEQWTRTAPASFGPRTSAALVYASYTYRRDYIEAVKLPQWQELAEQLTWEEALPIDGTGARQIEADSPTLRQSIAWELAKHALAEMEEENGVLELQRRMGLDIKINRVRAKLSFAGRSARLVYLPVYAISYTWGQTFNVHDERVPDSFLGILSGAAGRWPVCMKIV